MLAARIAIGSPRVKAGSEEDGPDLDAVAVEVPCTPADRSMVAVLAHPGRDLAAVGESQLGPDVLDVILRGAFGKHQGGSPTTGVALIAQVDWKHTTTGDHMVRAKYVGGN